MDKALKTMIDNMPEKTGKNLTEWLEILAKTNFEKHSLAVNFLKFGDDVVIAPKKGSVSLIRKKQFALIKPATKTRIDLGLKLKDIAVQGRLENSGPFGTMCTHRIQLKNIADIDNEVIGWLSKAYEKSV